MVREKNAPIAVFDSGMGGISVLRELVKLMPREDFLYFGDSKNAPYGTRELPEIQELTIRNIQHLMNRGCKAVAVACNTATSAAVRKLREMYPNFPIVGIEPAVKPACMENPGGKVLVMATPMTVRLGKLHLLCKRFRHVAQIETLSCPGLMEFVEEGRDQTPELMHFLEELLAPYRDVDAVVLGCTHYPFVRKQVQELMGDSVKIYDGAAGTARELLRRIRLEDLETERKELGSVIFENSDPTEERMERMKNLFRREE